MITLVSVMLHVAIAFHWLIADVLMGVPWYRRVSGLPWLMVAVSDDLFHQRFATFLLIVIASAIRVWNIWTGRRGGKKDDKKKGKPAARLTATQEMVWRRECSVAVS